MCNIQLCIWLPFSTFYGQKVVYRSDLTTFLSYNSGKFSGKMLVHLTGEAFLQITFKSEIHLT